MSSSTGSLKVFESKPVANEKSDGVFVQAISLKGTMRMKGTSEDVHDELVDVKVMISGVSQKQILIDNGLTHVGREIGAVKEFSLFDVQTTLDQFTAHDPYRISDHIIDQELWISPLNGDIRTRNEVRATYLDLEEQGGMEDMTFLQFLEGQTSVDELYEETPEVITAIRLYKHGYNFWGPRMQVYAGDSDNAGLWR